MPKITKERAAEILNKSPRAVERYSKADEDKPPLLSVTYEKGKTRDVPMYDEDEVTALAERLRLPATPARATLAPESQQTAIATRADIGDNLVAILHRLASIPTQPPARSETIPLADKLMLSIPEASRLSGIPADKLRAAVKSRKLKAVQSVGRGLGKVKRSDLDLYVKKL